MLYSPMTKKNDFELDDTRPIKIPPKVLKIREKDCTLSYKLMLGIVYTFQQIRKPTAADYKGSWLNAQHTADIIGISKAEVHRMRSRAEKAFHLVSFKDSQAKFFFLSPLLLPVDEWQDLRQFGTPNQCKLNKKNGIPEPYDGSFRAYRFLSK